MALVDQTATPSPPLSILLVTDDDALAREIGALAVVEEIDLARAVYYGDDLELAAYRRGANVVAFDVEKAPRRRVRTATAFAAEHPDVAVVLLSARSGQVVLSGLPLVARHPPETVLRELDRARALPLAFRYRPSGGLARG